MRALRKIGQIKAGMERSVMTVSGLIVRLTLLGRMAPLGVLVEMVVVGRYWIVDRHYASLHSGFYCCRKLCQECL